MSEEQKNDKPRVMVKSNVRYKDGLIDQLELMIAIEDIVATEVNETIEQCLNRNLKIIFKDLAVALEGIDLKIGIGKQPIERFLNERVIKLS